IELLLKSARANVNKQDRNNYTPLFYALTQKKIFMPVLVLLLCYGARLSDQEIASIKKNKTWQDIYNNAIAAAKEKINLKTHTDGRAISPGEISFVKSLPLDEKLAVLKYYLDPAIIERQIIKDVKDAK